MDCLICDVCDKQNKAKSVKLLKIPGRKRKQIYFVM